MADDSKADGTSADDVHRIELRARNLEQLRALLDGSDFDSGCRPVVRHDGDELVIEVYASKLHLDQLQRARAASGVTMTVIENASETGRARQAEVGAGNRFQARSAPPRGLGIKE